MRISNIVLNEIPETITRDKPEWRFIEKQGLPDKRYSISSNGDIRDNKFGDILQCFTEKSMQHKFVRLLRVDNELMTINITLEVARAFLSQDIPTRTVFYFKNLDNRDTYIRNIGICHTKISSLSDDDIHTICKLLEMNIDLEDICKLYNYIRKDVFVSFIKKLVKREVKTEISSLYKF